MENQQEPEKSYQPINDDFYDELEAAATLRQRCEITYRDDHGEQQEVIAYILDLYTDKKAEYARLDNHQIIRLDQIISLNNHNMPNRARA